jgi:ParB-like chromosome segregation protein Spo0J
VRQAGETTTVNVADLVPHPENYRAHGEDQVARLGASLDRYGQYRPVVVQASTNRILCGHGVVAAAKAAGEKTIAATVIDCDDDTARAILVDDNEFARLADDDRTALAELLADLHGTVPPIAYADAEIEDLLREVTMPRMGEPPEEFKEYDPEGMEFEHVCPKCGFEFNE